METRRTAKKMSKTEIVDLNYSYYQHLRQSDKQAKTKGTREARDEYFIQLNELLNGTDLKNNAQQFQRLKLEGVVTN